MLRAACFCALLVTTAGCGTVHFDVPEGRRVRLMGKHEHASVRIERPIWYVGWGAHPLSNNRTAPLIEEYNLTEVRLSNAQSWVDSIINPFTSILSFSRRTMVIEGNPDVIEENSGVEVGEVEQ